MVAFHGQMGMFTRALAYILSHGADGLRQVAEDAVLNANYVLRSLEDVLDAPFGKTGPCMHEAIFSDRGFAGGLSTIDLAKALIDEGFHPMTMYFPLVVHGAMLVEPTETESRAGARPVDRGDALDCGARQGRRPEPQGGARLRAAAAARRDAGGAQAGAHLPQPGARGRRRADPERGRRPLSERFYEAPVAGAAPLGARRAAQPRADRGGAWPSGCRRRRAGAGDRQRHRRACGAFRARAFPALDWQPSDVDAGALESIRAWRASEAAFANLREPVELNAAAAEWPVDRADAVLSINMVHISPWGVGARPARRGGAAAWSPARR